MEQFYNKINKNKVTRMQRLWDKEKHESLMRIWASYFWPGIWELARIWGLHCPSSKYITVYTSLCLFIFFFLSWAWIAPVDFTIPLLSVLVHLEESLLVLLSHVWWALQVHLGTEGNKSTLLWIMLRNNKRDSFLLSQKLTQL